MKYRIAGWSTRFENNKSRERDRCSFVCLPNKQDGLGLAHILSEPDGAALFGIWTLVVQACSRHGRPRNGWLTEDGTEDGTPFAVEDLAMRWRRPQAEICRMLEVMSRPKVGWLIPVGQTSTVAAVPVDGPELSPQCPGREEKGKEGKGREAPPPPVILAVKEKQPEEDKLDVSNISAVLIELVLANDYRASVEWAAACDAAGCRNENDDAAFLRWSVLRLRREMNIRYARDIPQSMLTAWAEWGRADYKRQQAALAAGAPK